MANHKYSPPRPDVGSQELTEEIIRSHAYFRWEKRGYEHGHDLEEWLEAEAEVMGKKPAQPSAAPAKRAATSAA